MIDNVTFSDFHDRFRNMDRLDGWTYDGLRAMFDYLEEYEDSTDEQIELDVIAICCDFSEYADLEEFQSDYSDAFASWDDVAENTTVIPVGDGAIVGAF